MTCLFSLNALFVSKCRLQKIKRKGTQEGLIKRDRPTFPRKQQERNSEALLNIEHPKKVVCSLPNLWRSYLHSLPLILSPSEDNSQTNWLICVTPNSSDESFSFFFFFFCEAKISYALHFKNSVEPQT